MKQIVFQKYMGLTLILFFLLVVAACGSQPAETAVEGPTKKLSPTVPKKILPTATKKPFTIPTKSDSSTGSSGNFNFSLPSDPKVPNGDIIDIATFLGTGGGPIGCPCVEIKSTGVAFTDFPPNVNAIVVVYEYLDGTTGLYLNHWSIGMDSNGYAFAQVSGQNAFKKYAYIVYDATTMERIGPSGLGVIDIDDLDQASGCPGTIKTRMSVGMIARVTLNGESLNIRYSPNIMKTSIIAELPEGRRMMIAYGPKCYADYVWWLVRTEKYNGWVAEGDDEDWYIEPAP